MSNSPSLSASDKTSDARTHLGSMRDSLNEVPKPQRTLIQEAFHELMETLDVLSAADEKLRVQNELLVKAREQLCAEQMRYQDLFEFAPDGYIVTDCAGIIQEANRAASILLNWPSRGLIRRTLLSFVEPDWRKAFREELKCLPALGYVAHFEIEIHPRASTPFPAWLTTNAIRDADGHMTGLRWLLRDITERKRCESRLVELQEELSRRGARKDDLDAGAGVG